MNHISSRKILDAVITSNEQIGKNVFRLSLYTPTVAGVIRPGQFVNVYLNDRSRLLPRPLSISSINDDNIILTYAVLGKGTKEISGYIQGTKLRISTPLGNGFDLSSIKGAENILLIGGGIGAAPLICLAQTLRKSMPSGKLTAVIGDKEISILANEFRDICHEIFVTSENPLADESCLTGKFYSGTVIDALFKNDIKADYVFACGPKAMLKAVCAYSEEKRIQSQISIDERMGCGFGACVGCSIKIKRNNGIVQRKVCSDGPVFIGSEVIWDD